MEPITAGFFNRVKGKRIFITGGTTGIGRATAEVLVSYGSRVFILGRDSDDLKMALQEIQSKYPDGSIGGSTGDVSKKEDVEALFKAAEGYLGGIDVLVNNAALPAEGLSESSFDEIKYVVDTNIMGYMAFAREAVNRMTVAGSGHVVNIGSMSAEVREETGTVYVATKAAIQGFSAALRKEVNPKGIKVSLIEPGAVTSDMQPGSKAEHQEKIEKMEMLEAEDIALTVLFCLCQPMRCDIVSLQVRPHLQLI